MAEWLRKLEHLDRRIIYLGVLLAVTAPLIRPVGLPIYPSKESQGFFDGIEALPAGSVVYVAADYDPGSMPELQPMLEAALRQLCRKNIKFVVGSLWPAAPPLVDRALQTVAVGEFGKVEGIDFVNLGFKEGREVVMVQVGTDLRSAYPTDSRGRSLDDLELTRNLRSLADLPLLVNVSAGYPGTKEWVQQVRSRFNLPMVAGCTAVSAPEYYPYFQSGQLTGLLGGLAGAAEYEKLVGVPGLATSGMDAQSAGHLAIILFIVLGNVIYFARVKEKRHS